MEGLPWANVKCFFFPGTDSGSRVATYDICEASLFYEPDVVYDGKVNPLVIPLCWWWCAGSQYQCRGQPKVLYGGREAQRMCMIYSSQ